jgi:hypothetical protein
MVVAKLIQGPGVVGAADCFLGRKVAAVAGSPQGRWVVVAGLIQGWKVVVVALAVDRSQGQRVVADPLEAGLCQGWRVVAVVLVAGLIQGPRVAVVVGLGPGLG